MRATAPWKVYRDQDGYHVLDSESDKVCLMNRWLEPTEAYREAQVIAAAPDLLAALSGLAEWGREHTGPLDANSPHDLLIAAVAAIAKAEGAK